MILIKTKTSIKPIGAKIFPKFGVRPPDWVSGGSKASENAFPPLRRRVADTQGYSQAQWLVGVGHVVGGNTYKGTLRPWVSAYSGAQLVPTGPDRSVERLRGAWRPKEPLKWAKNLAHPILSWEKLRSCVFRRFQPLRIYSRA